MTIKKKTNKSKGPGTGPAKAKTIAFQVPTGQHEQITSLIADGGYTITSVGVALFSLWVDGKIEIPLTPEKIRKDLTLELSQVLDSDPTKADQIKAFLAGLNKGQEEVQASSSPVNPAPVLRAAQVASLSAAVGK